MVSFSDFLPPTATGPNRFTEATVLPPLQLLPTIFLLGAEFERPLLDVSFPSGSQCAFLPTSSVSAFCCKISSPLLIAFCPLLHTNKRFDFEFPIPSIFRSPVLTSLILPLLLISRFLKFPFFIKSLILIFAKTTDLSFSAVTFSIFSPSQLFLLFPPDQLGPAKVPLQSVDKILEDSSSRTFRQAKELVVWI